MEKKVYRVETIVVDNDSTDRTEEIAKRSYHIGEVSIHYRIRSTPAKLRSLESGFRIGRTLIEKRFH